MVPTNSNVIRIYTPPVFEDDPDKSHAAHTLNLLIFGTGICLALYLLVTAVININVFTMVGVVLGGAGGYFLGRQFDRRVFGENWEEVPISRIRWESEQRK